MQSYIAMVKNDSGESCEYGLKMEERSGIYSGKLTAIITNEYLADPTILVDANELASGPLEADSIDGVKELASSFIREKYNDTVCWKKESF